MPLEKQPNFGITRRVFCTLIFLLLLLYIELIFLVFYPKVEK